jgi:hypothetical protein
MLSYGIDLLCQIKLGSIGEKSIVAFEIDDNGVDQSGIGPGEYFIQIFLPVCLIRIYVDAPY